MLKLIIRPVLFHFLKEVLSENKDHNQIRIGVASWYPIWRIIELVDKQNKIKVVSIKDNKTADFLYSNKISEVDKKYNKKMKYLKFYKIKAYY